MGVAFIQFMEKGLRSSFNFLKSVASTATLLGGFMSALVCSPQLLASEVNLQNPFQPHEKNESYCLDLPGEPTRLLESQLDGVLQKQGLYLVHVAIYSSPQNGGCERDQYLMSATPSLAKKLAPDFARFGVKVIGDINPSFFPPPTDSEKEKVLGLTQTLDEIAKMLVQNGFDQNVRDKIKSFETSLRQQNQNSPPTVHFRRLYELLSLVLSQFKKMENLLAQLSPLGVESFYLDYLDKKKLFGQILPKQIDQTRLNQNLKDEFNEISGFARSRSESEHFSAARKHLLSSLIYKIYDLFDIEGAPASYYDALSSVSMIALRELEELAPLNEVISVINAYFVRRPFRGLESLEPKTIGMHTSEFLSYLLRYSPHLHPLIRLKTSALQSNAQVYSKLAPGPGDILAYNGLQDVLYWAPLFNQIDNEVTILSATFGGVSERSDSTSTNVEPEISYIESWLKKHQVKLIDWKTAPLKSKDYVNQKAIEKIQQKFDFNDCEGFLTFKSVQSKE